MIRSMRTYVQAVHPLIFRVESHILAVRCSPWRSPLSQQDSRFPSPLSKPLVHTFDPYTPGIAHKWPSGAHLWPSHVGGCSA